MTSTAALAPTDYLDALLEAASPVLRIDALEPSAWCRNVQPGDPRMGPWRYKARYTVANPTLWEGDGEVLYLVTDARGQLRLVGQSANRLRDRWRLSPMHDVATRAALGQKALFHSSCWRQIEAARDAGEPMPFTVRALFRDELQALCLRLGGPLAEALHKPETATRRLSYHVETWICSLKRAGLPLWNVQKT